MATTEEEAGLSVLERSRIAPAAAPSSIGNYHTFPLSFLDIPWICFYPIHQLCFYDYPHPTSHFTQTLVPLLKHSLSLALHHFFPYAGYLVVFPPGTDHKKPEIRYVEGDSVSFLVAECDKDFDDLTGNHARKADEFYPLVPRLGQVVNEAGLVYKVPLLAVQATLFPGRGVCIGLTTHHIACDGNARVRFLRAWASIAKFGDDQSFLAGGSLIPFFDRSVLKDPRCLGEIFWKHVRENKKPESQPPHLSGPTDKVRASFVVTRAQIQQLKRLFLEQRPTLGQVSSFVVICAHVWTCLAKLHANGDHDHETEAELQEEEEGLVIPADARARLDPPIPETYFGNCLVGAVALAKRTQLMGDEGFLNAAEVIREAINKRFRSKESIFEGAETWMGGGRGSGATIVGIAGSPKFNIYEMDFGFGKPRKCEAVSIDYGGSVSLGASKESEDDLEISLSLPKIQMDAFITIFGDELEKIDPGN